MKFSTWTLHNLFGFLSLTDTTTLNTENEERQSRTTHFHLFLLEYYGSSIWINQVSIVAISIWECLQSSSYI